MISELLAILEVKKNYCQENEKGAEKVGVVRNEVEVIIKDYAMQRSIVSHEFVYLLIDVENHSYGYYQRDHENIGAQELFNDVPVQALQLYMVKTIKSH